MVKIHNFGTGGLWEDSAFIIATDYLFEVMDKKPCKHCHSKKKIDNDLYMTCPRVVIATNEGGYKTTGVCLDCIIEAAKTIEHG